MSDLCVVRPSGSDSSAQTLYAWAQDTVNDAAASRHTLHADLAGAASATRPAVEQEMQSCRALFFFGHGDWDTLFNGRTPIVDGQNVAKAQQKLLIAIACKSAHKLGNDAVAAGVEACLGFDEELRWTTGNSRQLWGNACTIGIRQMLLNQASIDEAADAMRREFDFLVHYFKYGAGKNDANAELAYLWATWDKAHICVRGSRTALL